MGKAVLALLVLSLVKTGCLAESLEEGFRHPPNSARPHTWWHWVNDNISKEGITADLEAMKRVGVGGAQIFNVDVGVPSGGVTFMSDRWREMVVHAVEEAHRLGIELCIHNCAGWSSSGGPWVKPEHAMLIVVTRAVQVQGPVRFSDVLPQPEMRAGFYRDIAVLAFPTPQGSLRIQNLRGKAAYDRQDGIQPVAETDVPMESVIQRDRVLNLTALLRADGRLEWDVPAGNWTILRVGYTPTGKDNHPATPEGRGLEVDKMSKEALDAFWNEGMMATVLRDIGPLAGKTLNNALVDSYEVGSQNWTPRFREEFRRRRGYDLLPFLPVFAGYVVGSPEISERFLWDVRQTVSELFVENYYGHFAALCRRHGLLFSTEPYGNGTFDDLAAGGRADIPMGEFWIGGGARETAKLAASSAHIYGRKVVGAEAFTATPEMGRWLNDPYSMKALGDHIFCLGVNRFIFHRYAHQPWRNVKPGMTMGPWGFHFERTITWWEQGRAWLKYLARCQYLLQQGRFVADIAIYVGEHQPISAPFRPDLREKGYDYDCLNREVLLRAGVRNGRIVLPSGMTYRVLVLPDTRFMTPRVLRKLAELVRAGAVVIGPKPEKSPSLSGYPQCDEHVRRLSDEVWGDCDGVNVKERRYGKGKVVWGKSIEQVLQEMGVPPDFEVTPRSRIEYIHRVVGDTDIYFVSNQRHRTEEVEALFRVSGKTPQLWHPDTGVIEPAPVYRVQGGRTIVRLRLGPAGSVFVVFRKAAQPAAHFVAVRAPGSAQRKPSQLLIRRAVYEAVDGAGSADVTERLRTYVRNGTLSVNVNNSTMGGDPTPMHYKRLRVEYTLDGKDYTTVVNENADLEIPEREGAGVLPAYELRVNARGKAEILTWRAGTYELRTSSGKSLRLKANDPVQTLKVQGKWTVRFPEGWGAPEQIVLDRLISWTEHPNPGVRYFSGTARYETTVRIPSSLISPDRKLYLSLGEVKNLCEVWMNGKYLGVLWKPPFRIEITNVARPGWNKLEIHVTNLWVNRLIGDEQYPDDCEWQGAQLRALPQWLIEGKPRPVPQRLTFTTWKHWTKDAPLLPSGLLGEVEVYAVRKLQLQLR
ncbi:MAG: glycosyl hydrolase [Armatimonadota bacterium]|nr:glycosyl hydrolase [Armatimonadota bacterium]